MTNTTIETRVHKFETAGLGKAPYAILGVSEMKFQACQGAPIQAGGSCDYCAAAIMYAVRLRSADGKTFKVGCDCAESIGDAGLKRVVSDWQRKHERKLREAAKARKAVRNVERFAGLLVTLDEMAAGPAGFAASFSGDLAAQIRRGGKVPSEKQLALVGKLRAEVA
jgi:hypothetical protein